MQLVFFKVAFFVLMGVAALGLVAIATMVATVILRALWPLLRIRPRAGRS